MASETGTTSNENNKNAAELDFVNQQIIRNTIEISRIQKEQYKEIKKAASGQSRATNDGSRSFVLGIALQSLQEEQRNLLSVKKLLKKDGK